MFSAMELRLIRYSIARTVDDHKKKLAILDPESDDAIELANDLMIFSNILEKINEKESL